MTRRGLVLLTLVSACNAGVEVQAPVRSAVAEPQAVFSDLLEIVAVKDTLDLTNRTGDPVFYYLTEHTGVTLGMIPAPCADPLTCPAVTRRDTQRIPFASIPLPAGATAIVVFHWRLVSAATPSGFQPDSVRSTIVPLR